MTKRKLFYTAGGGLLALLVLLVGGWLIVKEVIHKKIDERIRALPSSWRVSYRGLHADLFRGSLSVDSFSGRLDSTEHGEQAGWSLAVCGWRRRNGWRWKGI